MVKPIAIVELYERAERQGVEIIEVHTRKVDAAVFEDGFIFLDTSKFATEAELRCGLGHELGHWETGSFYNILTPYETWERCEHKANKRAAEILMPLDDVRRALRMGYTTAWALAHVFDVTLDFAEMALQMYESNLIRDKERDQLHAVLHSRTG